jgi:hypothetical protein
MVAESGGNPAHIQGSVTTPAVFWAFAATYSALPALYCNANCVAVKRYTAIN